MAVETLEIELWSEDAIVLWEWLSRADLREVLPGEHDAVLQALTDLLARLDEVVPYRYPPSADRVEAARLAVAKNMGW